LKQFYFFFFIGTAISLGQVFIDTDVYVDHTANLHIAAAVTEFHTGSIHTARGDNYGVVSFGSLISLPKKLAPLFWKNA